MQKFLWPSLAVAFSIVLSACAGSGAKQAPAAHYDFSGSSTTAAESKPLALKGIDIIPSSWLASNAMYYRLAYVDAARREQFATSRWTAPPAELLGIRLQQTLITGPAPSSPNACRLRLELDDWVQIFETPQRSQLQVEARATLLVQQAAVARRNFRLQAPAGVDAQSGVTVSGPLVGQLASELSAWIAQTCR